MDLLAMHRHYLRELKSRKDCRYCTRVSKLVYSSRRSMCCIGRRCKGAMLNKCIDELSKIWNHFQGCTTNVQRWGMLSVEILISGWPAKRMTFITYVLSFQWLDEPNQNAYGAMLRPQVVCYVLRCGGSTVGHAISRKKIVRLVFSLFLARNRTFVVCNQMNHCCKDPLDISRFAQAF